MIVVFHKPFSKIQDDSKQKRERAKELRLDGWKHAYRFSQEAKLPNKDPSLGLVLFWGFSKRKGDF